MNKEQVQIILFSKLKKYELPQTPILVPTNLKRYGLSEIVNHLLGNEKPIPFDFLIEGLFLRSSLEEYLNSKGISTENIINIEFIESLKPPTSQAQFPTSSWISSIKIAQDNLFYVASYDSTIQVWNTQNQCETKLVGHNGPVKSVSCLPEIHSQKYKLDLVSGSLDQTVIGWSKNTDNKNAIAFDQAYIGYGHTSSIDDITFTLDGSHFITASSDSTLKLWTTDLPDIESQKDILENGIEGIPSLANIISEKISKKSKKSKTTNSENSEKLIKVSKTTFKGHTGPVTAVVVGSSANNIFYSCGMDHSIRTWDIITGDNTFTKVGNDVVLSIDYSELSGLLVTGHTDNVVRVWDPRIEDTNLASMNLKGHSGWVKSTKWSSESQYMFATASYDGTSKIWDIRSTSSSMFSLPFPKTKSKTSELPDKLLALDWKSKTLVSGGQSGDLYIHSS
ncbi:hypothetical protein BB559_003395 [Furculomyces boomerangus]|uniref:Ribosome biogenesis protein YTM1 n=1 Tax=Furculomyces boomerangus TaxID=61424 RepID=A0A2T9YLI4_9FUNG|nr:hypothetical protein BB559_003395 [Furculomyces boomerangus]